MDQDLANAFRRALEENDVSGMAALLERYPEAIRKRKDDSGCPWSLLASARSVEMAEFLLRHGADLGEVSECWAPAFGLRKVPSEVAEHLVERGVRLSPHAAAALGLASRLGQMLDHQPGLVHAKGGDGGCPLHFSRNLEIARLLVERGADLEARDDDHDSTPAQWLIGDAPDVTRFLLEQGAAPDIFMAAGLGDFALAKRLLDENPACASYRIGNNKSPFPGIGFQGRGGTIYQWTLGFNQSPHEIARNRGHLELVDLLMAHTPPRPQLLVACMLEDRPLAERLVASHPDLIRQLDEEDTALLAKSCWETNLNRNTVRLMLDMGFPVDAPEWNHGFLPLHNAAWCGDLGLVELLLQRGHPVDRRDPTYQSTALGWAIHSCVTAKRHPQGEFPQIVRLLLESGTPCDEGVYPTGHDGVDAVLRAHLNGRNTS